MFNSVRKLDAGDATDRFDCGHPALNHYLQRYAWLNQVIAVAQGRVCHGRVEYRVFACAND